MPNRPEPHQSKLRDNRYWQALIVHYSVGSEIIFKQFRLGVIAFGIGLGLILIANSNMPPFSIEQELCALAGLIIGGIGFIVAMLAQVRLMISRFVHFYTRKDN